MFSRSDSFKSFSPRNSKGFSLIELMVVVAIIGIITAIALPSYQDYVVKAALVDAHNGLANGRVVAEQWYQDNRNYDVPDPGFRCPAATPNFTFACARGANTFLITATGIGRAAGFTMTVNQANVRATPTAKSGWATSATCWVTGKSGC